MDKIVICGLPLRCHVGVSAEERAREQQIFVDAELFLDLRLAGETDEPERTVDYVKVCDALTGVASGKAFHLIEAQAEAMASTILASFPVEKVFIRVRKPEALADRGADYAAVEVEREKHG